MKIRQGSLNKARIWKHLNEDVKLDAPLVLIFANRYLLEEDYIFSTMRHLFPNGHLVYASTSGEILGDQVSDGGLAYTAIEFENSVFKIVSENILNHEKNSIETGNILAQKIEKKTLNTFL
mgnify:CR=1 FL=1|tara:strand:+ start:222 stop:584 length:363 start_codon:yes stop_codon:yes gene_type:complete